MKCWNSIVFGHIIIIIIISSSSSSSSSSSIIVLRLNSMYLRNR